MPGPVDPKPAPVPQSSAQLMAGTSREFIMIAGKDGAGKTSAIVSIAAWVEAVLNPTATFFVIDTENKFPTALRSFGADAPTNIQYYKCETMNDVTEATDIIMEKRKPGDWLAVESMERAQDMGYLTISGFTKAAYMEKRRTVVKNAPITPDPSNFWNIVKGAHDGAFLDLISQASTLNAVLSTTVAKPPKADSFAKESPGRKETRIEFGLDAGLDGAPRIPYYVETLLMLKSIDGKIKGQIIRDNLGVGEVAKPEFDVEDKKSFATKFWITCRG